MNETIKKDKVDSVVLEYKVCAETDSKCKIKLCKNSLNHIWRMLSGKRVYKYDCHPDSKILFVYPHDYFVKSHYLKFEHFMQYFNKFDYFYYQMKAEGRRKKILQDIVWIYKSLKNAGREYCRFDYYMVLSCMPVFLDQWKNVNLEKYNLVVFYNELSPISSYIINICKTKGIKTATLQHGEMGTRLGDDSVVSRGRAIPLKYSIADYFLAWNKYTAEMCRSMGMSSDKVIVAGLPGYVGYDDAKKEDKIARSLCIILTGTRELDNENKTMIEIAKKFSEDNGYSYWFRYHPNQHGDEYNDLTDEHYMGNANQASIVDLGSEYDIYLCCASSVYIELLVLKAKVYRFKSEYDLYDEYGGSFYDYESLLECINNYDFADLKEYLMPPVDQDKKYYEFFMKFAN